MIRMLAAAIVVWTSAVAVGDVEQRRTDLLVVGATESGWAAAIQAARNGVESITIVHDGDWIGGQYTEQALACVDENKGVDKVGWGVDWHPMRRSFHRFGLFKELMDRIEAFNTRTYGSAMPGKPWHGPSTFRPAEAETIFREMLQPFLDSGQVTLITNRYPVRADVTGNRLTGLWFAPVGEERPDLHVAAKITIDASDWGEAIQVSGAAYECGPDPHSRYGEPSAPADVQANEMNPITWAMIVVESDHDTPISKPPRFDDRNYPRATHLSLNAFRGLQWDHRIPQLGAINHWPDSGQASERQLSVFSVRRIVDGSSSKDRKTSILLNYMNGQDYPLERLPQPVVDALEATERGASTKNIVDMTRAQREIVFRDAKQHALGVLYHLQNFVHDRAPDKTNSFRHFQLSREFGTHDNLPPKPYIRESLRLKAMYMMREQDGRNRDSETKTGAVPRFSEVMYPDGLFAWQFHYDFHRTGRTYLNDEGPAGPWIDFHKPNRHTNFVSDRCVFPLRSLIPETMDGLLGAQGNVGFSSIVSAAIRLHDQRIHIGQAAGATAAVALRLAVEPRSMPYSRSHLEAVRHALCGEVESAVPMLLRGYRDLPANHPAFVAINRLAALDLLPVADTSEVDFRPNDPATDEWIATLPNAPKAMNGTRGEFCRQWWETIHERGLDGFLRTHPDDADGDGIPDYDDALLFTPNKPIRFIIRQPSPVALEPGRFPSAFPRDARFYNFRGPETRSFEGEFSDHGEKFDEKRGHGWKRNLSSNHRARGAFHSPRDTFVFTRQSDTWECKAVPGRYRVTLCVGDAHHEQRQQKAAIEGSPVFDEITTAAGEFAEKTIVVDVRDGRLTLDIGSGKPDSNTCINWLVVESVADEPGRK